MSNFDKSMKIETSINPPRETFDFNASTQSKSYDSAENCVQISSSRSKSTDTIDEEQRGRPENKHRYKKSFTERTGHSPTGSLDPIITGHHLGVGSDKVGTEVQVTSAAIDTSSDDGASRLSSFDDGKPPHAR
ncbi:hypothetical protein EON65_34170 [archaeon]|nr:MAG: hypothetical protein EON65_34170 [archaeon]